jgi:hypothetical protein
VHGETFEMLTMTLKEYIHGKRKGKAANRLERQAMNDPFLHDALEGYDALDTDALPVLERLERKVLYAANRRRRAMVYWSIAASVFLLIGFGSLFLLQQKPTIRMPDVAAVVPKKTPPDNEKDTVNRILPVKITKAEERKTLAVVASSKHEEILPQTVTEEIVSEPPSPVKAETAVSVPQPIAAKLFKARTLTESSGTTTVRGTIVDEMGQTIPGVAVKVQDSNKGTVTDVNGNFSLRIPPTDSAKLVASYIGYDKKEFSASDKSMTIALKPSVQALNEVVVVGYGSKKMKSVTGSVAKFDPKSFGEKEFSDYCKTQAKPNLCGGQKMNVNVKVLFVISKKGIPTEVQIKKATCDEAASEMERLLKCSPVWTKKDRKVTLTIEW